MERPTIACGRAGYSAGEPGSQNRAADKEIDHVGVYYHAKPATQALSADLVHVGRFS